jgi:putative CocE/NonD family hydrolase
LNVRRRLERRWLGLPPARSALIESSEWMATPDGARLATQVLRPAEASVRRGTVLIRTERPLGDGSAASPIERIARWLAEDGRTVAIQSCRGRGDSEGEFRAFADELADGGAALQWIAQQPWRDGELVLCGLGYSAFTAWAALATGRESVAGIATGFGARDPYAWLHRGGVLQLEAALALAARLDGRYGHEPAELDLARAARHRPLRECDRVALRELSAFRDWLAHPEPDDWWAARTPALPVALPRALFVSGWYECAFEAAYRDYEIACAREGAAPELRLGPWGAAPLPRAERARGADALAETARAFVRFVARTVEARPARDLPTRVFVRGVGWREATRWPPATATQRALFLRSDGRANSVDGDGRLAGEPDDDRTDTFVADPADPVPSLGGAAVAGTAGALDQGLVEARGDVLCFTSEPLSETLELAGRVRLSLHAEATQREVDTTAKLVSVAVDGTARWLAEGVVRADAAALAIELGAVAARLAAGTRLRVELAGSSLPRFARGEANGAVARTVHHGRARPSALHFHALE